MDAYTYCRNSPVMLVDPDGNFAFIPWLLRYAGQAAVGAMMDMTIQVAAEKYFGNGGNGHKTWGAAWDAVDINELQVLSSAGESLIKNKHMVAAFSAVSDMTNYYLNEENPTLEGGIGRGALGVMSAYMGIGAGKLIAKYGAKSVARGLMRNFKIDANQIRRLTNFDILHDLSKSLARNLGGTAKKAKGDGSIITAGEYTIRVMYNGGQRTNPYFRISKNGKGAIDQNGNFSSDRAATHIDFIGDPSKQIMEIIRKNEQ